ncbi:hypothetical protein ACWDBD_03045 [Streptomyces sp. NPDC001118]|uniref:hypothetical protein n=1 Tax=Streptomyces sp. NPDC002589 TaxID=3154420 RepID=UPI00332CD6A4
MRSKLAGLAGIVALAAAFGAGVMVHDLGGDASGQSVHKLATNEGPGLYAKNMQILATNEGPGF